MDNFKSGATRYSDEELILFKDLVEKKIEKSETELNFMLKQIEELNENKESEGDWMDDTSTASDLEMLYTMVGRNKQHTRDLKNALLRIYNKSYGICSITGELIDKRRLLAVLTTSKSLAAKTAQAASTPVKVARPTPIARKPEERKIISKIIKPLSPKSTAPISDEDEDEDEDDLEEALFDSDFEINETELETED